MQWCSLQEQEDWQEEATYEQQKELLSGAGDVEDRINRVVMEMVKVADGCSRLPLIYADRLRPWRDRKRLLGRRLMKLKESGSVQFLSATTY